MKVWRLRREVEKLKRKIEELECRIEELEVRHERLLDYVDEEVRCAKRSEEIILF